MRVVPILSSSSELLIDDCELMDVGVAGLHLCPAGGHQRFHELADELADLGGELPAFLRVVS
jgi:hypothetical protein